MAQVIDTTHVHHELTWADILAAHEQRPSTSWANQVEEAEAAEAAEASADQKPTGGAYLGADAELMAGLHIPATVDPTSMPQTNVKMLNCKFLTDASLQKRALDRDYRTVCRMMARLMISPKPPATEKTKASPAFPPSTAASFSLHAPPAQPASPHSSTLSSFSVGGVRPQYGHGKEGRKVWSKPQKQENGRGYNKPYRQMRAYYKARHPIKKERSCRRRRRYCRINRVIPEPPAPKPAFPHRLECYCDNNRPYGQMRGQQNYTKLPHQAYYKTTHSIKNDRSPKCSTHSPLNRPNATVAGSYRCQHTNV